MSVPNTSIRAALGAACVAAATLSTTHPLAAQERLTGARTLVGGAFAETYHFGDGLAQEGGASGPSVVKDASQFVVPLSLAIPLGDRWSADVATVYTHGTARILSGAAGSESTVSLAGVGDVRVRATGRLVGDRLLLTLGANVATGVRELTNDQVLALGVLAAPALGSVMPAASAGPSVTSGLVYALHAGRWSWAAGAGAEVRGRYAPVAALAAGLAAPSFDPGTAVHLSFGGNGFLADGAFSVLATADVYTQDRLALGTGTPTTTAPGGVATEVAATVKLGPTLGLDASWQAPTTRFRDLTLHGALMHRTAFTRDGASVAGTSASYLAVGVRSAYPLGRATDLTTNVDAWLHGGLTADNTLVTAKTTSGALGIGIARRLGTYALQPYARLRVGTIDTGVGSTNVTGTGLGVNLTARF